MGRWHVLNWLRYHTLCHQVHQRCQVEALYFISCRLAMLLHTHQRFPRFRPPYSIPVVMRAGSSSPAPETASQWESRDHSMPILSLLETTRKEQGLFCPCWKQPGRSSTFFSKLESQQELRDLVSSHAEPQMPNYS